MNVKKNIPNAITCCNLISGCFGILFTFNYRLDLAFYMVLLAAVFDFFDGFAARILNVSSPIGKDLDSLADMITFGVLPGFIMYKMIGFTLAPSPLSIMTIPLLACIAFLIPVFSALRLAKFNNDTRQTESFIGVNTPANTLLISSLGYIIFQTEKMIHLENRDTPVYLKYLISTPYPLICLTLLMCYLLVSEIPIFALKFKNFGWPDNKIRYLFLIIALILLILFQFFAFPFIILLYILLSLINTILQKGKPNS